MFRYDNERVNNRLKSLCVSNTVLVQETSLRLNGLTKRLDGEIYMYSKYPMLNRIGFPGVEYFYFPNYDLNNFLEDVDGLTNVKIPTRERAIVDYYRLNEYDEETMLQAIKDYFYFNPEALKLRIVAEFYGVDWNDILRLKEEAEEYLTH